MKQIAAAIIVVLGIGIILAVSSGWLDIGKSGHVSWNTPAPQATPNAGDAAANATMVAQQQSAQMTASAAQSEMQATAQAAVAWATEQAMVADQAHQDQMATRRAEATAQVIQATATRQAVKIIETRQAAEATAVIIQVTVEAEERVIVAAGAEREGRRLFWEGMWANLNQSLEKVEQIWLPFMCNCMAIIYGVVLGLVLSIVLLRLFQREEKKCETKVMPS